MSRRSERTKTNLSKKPLPVPFIPVESSSRQWVRWLLSLSRLTRIGIVTLFALSTTFAVFPLVDEIYLRFFYTAPSVIVPSLVSAGLGLAMYVLGWWLLVGTVDEIPPARTAVLWYVGLGLGAILLISALVIFGFATGTAPIE